MKNSLKERYIWLDVTRGLAILWVFLVHFYERFGHGSMFANPHINWPPLSERIAQLSPIDVHGLSGIFINLLRYVGWLGDQGVQIFLVASGFGLALSALNQSTEFSMKKFYAKRMVRILPLWFAAHIVFIATYVVFNKGLSPTNWRTWASILGLRFIPHAMYYKFPAWWYIGLLLQLYTVFPLLFLMLRRWSPVRFFMIVGGTAIIIRLAGLILFEQNLDWWSRGGLFLSRLPEFTFGMAFAKWLATADSKKIARLRRSVSVASIIGLYLLGNICSFFLLGMSVAFLLTGACFFLFIFSLYSQKDLKQNGLIAWSGRRSYAIYLFHHPVILFLVPSNLAFDATGKIITYLVTAGVISIIGGLVLETATNYVLGIHRRWITNRGLFGAAVRWITVLAIIPCLAIGAEAFIRKVDPQEVLGWGERPSLEPHATYGYRLKPNKTTRLRWLSYDYTVEANALGFPGSLYNEKKPDSVYRIMVTGDAFESAEGVDTPDAWPRLLEKKLNSERGIKAQVLNFSITGWGPNQYASVITDYAPKFKPDIIIVGFFVNEFDDVKINNDKFRNSIGFQKPSQSSTKSYIRLLHLRAWVKINIVDYLKELIRNKPNHSGYFFGYFRALLRKNYKSMAANAVLIEERLKTIVQTTQAIQARLLIVLVPSAVQVCSPATLKYYPKSLDLSDSARFDLNQPQRLAKKMCKKLNIPFIDLRNPLQKVADMAPYQPKNMHLTKLGHKVVAQQVLRYLYDNEYPRLQKAHLIGKQ
jgi:peptidoglycan/LPS O-acetylase OafA/YrhL